MRKVVFKEWVTRDEVQSNREIIYLFGDNTIRQGYAGQANAMRGEPNAIGIVTKRFPSNRIDSFFYDHDFEEAVAYIDRDFASIPNNVTVIIPRDGLGTGLAKLDIQAPKIFQYILDKIDSL